MKTTTIPSVRVEPEFREQIEQVLRDGETLSALVESAVRDIVRRRQDQSEFIRRGLASLDAARHSGHYVDADAVVQRLEERLALARATKKRPKPIGA